MSKSPGAARQVNGRKSLTSKDKEGTENPAFKRQKMNQNTSPSPKEGNVTTQMRTRSHNLDISVVHNCNLCEFSTSTKELLEHHLKDKHCPIPVPSPQMDRAELLPLHANQESDQSMGDEMPTGDFTAIMSTSKHTQQQLMNLRGIRINQFMPGDSSTSRNEADVIYCSRCCFWARTPKIFHEHLFQCDKKLSCSACGFCGTRMDVLHHIHKCVAGGNAGQSAASCISLNVAMPDNKYADLRQSISVRNFVQYGFAQEIKEELGSGEVVAWKPMASMPDFDSSNQNELDAEELNYQTQKEAIKIKMEETFRKIGEFEKDLSDRVIRSIKLKKDITEFKKKASNEDQDTEMELSQHNRLVTQKLNLATICKEKAETAQSKKLEEVKFLRVEHHQSGFSKDTARILQEAEQMLERLNRDAEEKFKNWSTLLLESNKVSRQLSEAGKAMANNIDWVFFLNNSLTKLNSTIDNVKEQIDIMKSSIPELFHSRREINEALLKIAQKKKSDEFCKQEAKCLEDLCRKFGYPL